MTFDEMNRAMEFIIQNEAQISIRMEEVAKRFEEVARRHNEIAADLKDLTAFHKRDHGLLVQMAAQQQTMSELLQIQSRRLDRAEQEDRAARKRHEELLDELRAGFDRILAKLPDKPN